jgi:hypothetical protein
MHGSKFQQFQQCYLSCERFLQQKLTEEGLLQDMILYCACCDDEWSATTDHFKDLELIATKVCHMY